MAHFLDNDWNLVVITFNAGLPTLSPDGTFHLMHNLSNQLDSTSRHGANELTGRSRPDGGSFEITFVEKIPDSHGGFQFRAYTGRLMDHSLESGVTKKVIGGFRSRLLATAPPLEDLRTREGVTTFGQNDGVWVGTQP